MKIYTNEFGHMTNMAAMPIYGKNLKKSFSRTNRPITLKLSMWHCLCKYYQSCLHYDPGLTLTHFTPRSYMYLGKSDNHYFLETIAAFSLKVASNLQINELMKSHEYQRSRSFFDLGQRSLKFQS